MENGSLFIREVAREDAGHYMVQAINGVGPGISLVLRLTVHGMNAGQTNVFQVQVSQCNRMKGEGKKRKEPHEAK